MSPAAAKPLQVACPHCRQAALFAPSNPWRPFCSERCRQIDMGAWATDSYRVAATPDPGSDDDTDSPPAAPAH